MITFDRANELLSFNSETGILSWKILPDRKTKNFPYITHTNKQGYVTVMVDNKLYRAHRIAWLLHYKEMPKGEIDHINQIKNDNRIINLRCVDRSTNQRNTPVYKNSLTGIKGVSFKKETGKWAGHIRINGKQIHLGYFDDPEKANAAYLKARSEYENRS